MAEALRDLVEPVDVALHVHQRLGELGAPDRHLVAAGAGFGMRAAARPSPSGSTAACRAGARSPSPCPPRSRASRPRGCRRGPRARAAAADPCRRPRRAASSAAARARADCRSAGVPSRERPATGAAGSARGRDPAPCTVAFTRSTRARIAWRDGQTRSARLSSEPGGTSSRVHRDVAPGARRAGRVGDDDREARCPVPAGRARSGLRVRRGRQRAPARRPGPAAASVLGHFPR